MNTPSHLECTVESLAKVARSSQASCTSGVKALRSLFEVPRFNFTELSLSDAEIEALWGILPLRGNSSSSG